MFTVAQDQINDVEVLVLKNDWIDIDTRKLYSNRLFRLTNIKQTFLLYRPGTYSEHDYAYNNKQHLDDQHDNRRKKQNG